MSIENLTGPERDLLDLLVDLNRIESKCRRLGAALAVPKIVYQKLAELRNEIAFWGTENIAEHSKKEKTS
ncbi:MAG: hypothetical protein GWN87_24975 [Desulfuromonadales bacterium]|nr:hypothetical protein [Desulfuromonadales bacterium]